MCDSPRTRLFGAFLDLVSLLNNKGCGIFSGESTSTY